jgi:endonuclease/exonuclease/phosphatase family metal-dependent hydrolase
MHTLRIATYNIHKGFPFLNRRLAVHELRERLRAFAADLVFLQEVHGAQRRHAAHYDNWPVAPQYEFLADAVWPAYVYGRNSVYDEGHHGNAILSRFPILSWENEDISSGGYERRGLLHCEVHPPHWPETLHCVCVHLGLWGRHRGHQIEKLRRRIERLVPPSAPLIVAGDFNDWRFRVTHQLAHPLNLHEVFELMKGRPARSFPAMLPVMSLDRIYVRGLRVEDADVHQGRPWARISDHAALTSTLTLLR